MAKALTNYTVAKRAEIRDVLRKDPDSRTPEELDVLRRWLAVALPERTRGGLDVDALVRVMLYRTIAATEVVHAQGDAGYAM